VLQNGRLLLQSWPWYPALEKLLARVSIEHPLVPVGKPQYVSFDLIGFVTQPEHERRRLLTQLKQLGFGPACVLMLKQRMRMPGTDAARLMESL
jgi:hypothetical protein